MSNNKESFQRYQEKKNKIKQQIADHNNSSRRNNIANAQPFFKDLDAFMGMITMVRGMTISTKKSKF